MDIRTATQMEKARKQAIAISAFLVVVMLGISATFIALTLRGATAPGGPDVPIGGPNTPDGGTVTPAFIMPLSTPSAVILKTANFDLVQKNRTQGWYEFDLGYTIGASEGAAVVAAYKGTVKEVTTGDSSTGKLVRIQHDNGLETVYSSLESVDVVKGQAIAQGARIGVVGNTAYYERFDMPHVRFEMYENGKPVNPEKYVEFPDSGSK